MRKTTIKTSVTFTSTDIVYYNTETETIHNTTLEIPATAKTEKGLEKLISEYLNSNEVLVKVKRADKVQVWYEMDRATFMSYATPIDK